MTEADLKTHLAVLTERLSGTERALMLQAKEYERRLLELNNAHERAERALAAGDGRYLSRDLFDNTVKEWQSWRGSIDLEVSKLSNVLITARTLEDKVNMLISQITTISGRGQGLHAAWLYTTAAVAAAVGITVLITFFSK